MYSKAYIQMYSQKYDNERTIIMTDVLGQMIKANRTLSPMLTKTTKELRAARAEIGRLRRQLRIITGVSSDQPGPSPG